LIWTLYKLELYKMVKRLAFWVALISFATLLLFFYGSIFYSSYKYSSGYSNFSFPNAWPMVLSDSAEMVCVFSGIVAALLIASEFDWRTSRQNIIDGLSKGQWFSAKLLLLPTIVSLFYGTRLLIAGSLAWLGTRANIERAHELINVKFLGLPGYFMTSPFTQDSYDFSSVQFLAFAGVILAALMGCGLGLLFSLITRSAGPAMGITVIYIFLEGLANNTMRGLEWNTVADFFPFQVVNALCTYYQYLPAGSLAREKLIHTWDTPLLFAAGIGWIIVFVIAAWLVYRLRDL
jgi:hypothetical protein